MATRVEGLTRVHGIDVLITEEVWRARDGRFLLRDMPPVPVKGKAKPIVTHHLQGLEEHHVGPHPPIHEPGAGSR